LYVIVHAFIHHRYSKGNDYWALGILVYEIINGYTPFGVPEADQTEICRRIIKEKLLFPTDCDDELGMDLMARLLEKDWMKRLGCGKNGAEDIKAHPWFNALDFRKLARKEVSQ
jgi:serine/threonine protein kinase